MKRWDSLKQNKFYHKFKKLKYVKKSFFLLKGTYGLQVLEFGFLNLNHLKMIAFFFNKNLKKTGKIWFNVTPNYIETKKPVETRMGRGKGNIENILVVLQPGKIFFEVTGFNKKFIEVLLKTILKKLPIKCRILQNKL